MFIVLILIMIALGIWAYNDSHREDGIIAGLATCFIILVVLLVIAGCSNAFSWSDRMDLQGRYEAVKYKLSSGIYNDKLEIRDVDVIDQIVKLNQQITVGKALQRDFWVGPFIPNIYDGLEPIDYKSIIK